MIRRATSEDVGVIVAYGERFHAVSPWAYVPYDREATGRFVAGVVEHGAVFLSDEGMCGGVLSPVYFNPAHVLAVELFWWAPTGGRELKAAFEAWAKEAGAHEVQFGALENPDAERLAKVYARAGFTKRETAFTKRIAA